ncbi:hypothetical protein C8J57DRAFT_1729387 [Mycena rebaudengoi]|nr:hypothetical protein C8J57DRAFT_1729387 [Mycena rebaudengoi]
MYPVHHVHYITSLKTPSDDSASYPAATLRIYSAAGDAPLPDNTVAFVVAKAFAPTNKPIELDALFLSAVPGDPNDDDYDERVPDFPVFIYGVGHIPANHVPQSFDDGGKAFTLSLTEYVAGGSKSSTIQCLYPGTRRWTNVPLPRAQSCTQFLGMCHGFADSALLRIALEHVTLSLGPHTLQTTATSTIPEAPTATHTPRRKKYVAIGSTSTTPTTISKTSTDTTARHSLYFVSFLVSKPNQLTISAPCRLDSTSKRVHHRNLSKTPELRQDLLLPRSMEHGKSKKLKRRASAASLSPPPDDNDDDIEEIPDTTPIKGKGKKKAK